MLFSKELVENIYVAHTKGFVRQLGNDPDPSFGSFGNLFNSPATASNPLIGGCQSLPSNKTSTNLESGNKEFNYKIYPNPSKNGVVTIETNIIYPNSTIRISTLNGYELTRLKILEKKTEIHLNLPSGIYILSVENNKSVHHEKLVIAD